MAKEIQRLVGIGSEAIGPDPRTRPPTGDVDARALAQLRELYELKNGFQAFESALLVLPLLDEEGVPGLVSWNRPSGWRRYYRGGVDDVLFFAMDTFANQFGISPKGVIRMEAESGEISAYSLDIESWAQRILSDYSLETGWSVAREWQLDRGPLPINYRLLPKRPFVLGGDYVVENLVGVEMTRAMELLGNLCSQISATPDGQRITVRGWAP